MEALEIFITNLKEMVENNPNQLIITIDITTTSAKKVIEAYEKYHKNESDNKPIMEYLIMGEGK